MKLSPVVAELKAAGLKRVYAIRELTGLRSRPERLPAFFVVPIGETAEANTTSGIHDQLALRSFGVVVMMDGAARSEEAIADELADEEDKVIQALAGWTHPQASRACDYAGGDLLSADGSSLSWMVRFRTARRIRKAS